MPNLPKQINLDVEHSKYKSNLPKLAARCPILVKEVWQNVLPYITVTLTIFSFVPL